MMNIWQILQIEPTDDLRAIKKAYANRSREVHPEEKPEEFSQLYEAYKNALTYVKMAKVQELEDYKPEIPAKNDSDVFIYFIKKQEYLQEKLEEFQKQWAAITKPYYLSSANEQWVEYLKSENFQEIRWNSQVLELLEQKMEKLNYAQESKMALWDAYGFNEENHLEYNGDVLRLFKDLQPAYDRIKQREREEEERLERITAKEKNADPMKTLFRFVLLLFCVATPFFVYFQLTAERRFVSTTMRHRYSADSFTIPKKSTTLPNGNTIFTFYSRNHPELMIRATVSQNNWSEYSLQEDYGLKLLQYYGELYGVEFDVMEGHGNDTEHNSYHSFREYVIFYSDIENVDRICDSFFTLLEEKGNGELSYLDSVGICWKNALYPKVMVGGGVQSRPPVQIYIVEELNDRETLKKSVKAAYVDYMYNYEAWNLTSEQQVAYGPAYVSKGRAARVEDSGNPWSSDYQIKRIEAELDLYIPIYEKEFYERGVAIPNSRNYTSGSTRREIYITVGNAYQLLKASGAEVSVKEDGSSFTATREGMSRTFGYTLEQKLSTVMELLMEAEDARSPLKVQMIY